MPVEMHSSFCIFANYMTTNSTICALSTPQGSGAIAVIRISGKDTFKIVSGIFKSKSNKKLDVQNGYSIHLGSIIEKEEIIDEVLISIFRSPRSFTGEDMVEISCHGSQFIQSKILQLLINNGAQMASPGEFTMRAFMNGKMDLTQAEAIADIINSKTKASHKVAMNQMKGGITEELRTLREKLLNFTSLIELELDFSEEDVEFANRTEFKALVYEIKSKIERLVNSFQLGNAIKEGIPVVIAGKPNVGKSTLLNHLLNEEKAIVSEIEGTTRDVIEDVVNIEGFLFRFIDTAGLRETIDTIEKLGIDRTHKNIDKADIVLFMIDASEKNDSIMAQVSNLTAETKEKTILVFNKVDKLEKNNSLPNIDYFPEDKQVAISAYNGNGINNLIKCLLSQKTLNNYDENEVLISNTRHFDVLSKSLASIARVEDGIQQGIPTDLIAIDIRETLYHLGEVTGTITTDEVLGNIFKNFCIGK